MYQQKSHNRLRTPREALKLVGLKAAALGLVVWCSLDLAYWDTSISDRFISAAAAASGIVFYINLFRVKGEVAALFEPPYEYDGVGLSIVAIFFSIAAIYYQIH